MKFPAEHFEPADMIAMFVGEEHAIQLLGSDPALREAQNELARAQPAVDEQPAMIGRDQRAVPGAPAPEHRQSEHVRLVADALAILKRNSLAAPEMSAALRSWVEATRLHYLPMKPIFLSLADSAATFRKAESGREAFGPLTNVITFSRAVVSQMP